MWAFAIHKLLEAEQEHATPEHLFVLLWVNHKGLGMVLKLANCQEWKEKQGQEGKESGWWEGKLQAEYRQLTGMGAAHIPHPVIFNSFMALLRQESFSLPEFGLHL